MRILITGAAGFIGHHLVEHILKTTDHEIVIIDRLTYASTGFDRLKDIGAYENPRIKTFTHDFCHEFPSGLKKEIGMIDYIVHMGAETHVDRSIKDPWPFLRSNVWGTVSMLDYAKTVPSLKKFLYFSTDEVFGPAPEGVAYKEWDRYNCTNPYAASKAAGEEFCLAYANCYDMPIVITHCMNVFGERQHKEKYVPIVMNKILKHQELEIHCTDGVPASRAWIHARNVSSAVLFLLGKGEYREKYNIVGEEHDNVEIAALVSQAMGRLLLYKKVNYYADRPGHDPRYMLNGEKLSSLGWKVPINFEQSFIKTIQWTLEHPRWLE